jgi:hypothetical protein
VSTPPSTHDREELRLLYQITVGDLTYFKTQQWSVTNYSLLLYAGIVGVAQMLKPTLTGSDRIVLASFTIAIATAALFVLAKLEKSISVRQSRLDVVRSKFTDAFQFAWTAEDKGKERVHAVYLLRTAVVVGAIVVIWLAGWRL